MAREKQPESMTEASELVFPDLPTPETFTHNGVHGPSPAVEVGPDPFDPESLRIPQELSAALGVKRALLTVPVRRPSKEWFVRVHADTAYHLHSAFIELKESQELYLVAQHLWPALGTEATFVQKLLLLAVNRQGTAFFWPLRLPATDGRVDTWSRSALEASDMAMHRWVRVTPDTSLGGYTVFHADHATEPVWPELSMRELLRVAFKDRYIDALDHPVLRQLRGEV